jgi:hypothetical protein
LKLDLSLSPYTNINSKQIKNLNVSFETTIGKSKENTGTYRLGNNFLDKISNSSGIKKKN